MFGARLGTGAYLQTQPSTAFDFSTGDFTVSAMLMGTSPGVLVSHQGVLDGINGGFVLKIGAEGAVVLLVRGRYESRTVASGKTSVLDGGCHVVTAIRQAGVERILLDGEPVPTTVSGASGPIDVANGLPLTIGFTQQPTEPDNQFAGMIMNVGVWSVALSEEAMVKAQFGQVSAADPGLQGYWTLDATSEDLSRNANPAAVKGAVRFMPCIECVWASGAHGYEFCRMTNLPHAGQLEELAQAGTLTMVRELEVPAGAPTLCGGIMAAQDRPAFPAGATVSLTDPAGKTYNQEVNTEAAFVRIVGGQLWAAAISNPIAGTWRLTVTAPAASAFALTFNTGPTGAVVETVTDALEPIYGSPPPGVVGPSSWWWTGIAMVAVGAVAAVVIVATFGTGTPAVVAAGLAFATGVSAANMTAAFSVVDDQDLTVATTQIAGLTCFLVSVDKVLLIDQNEKGDEPTETIYRQRQANLYPRVTASPYNQKQQSLIGAADTRANLSGALSSFKAGYVSISCHGKESYLYGWKYQIVLSVGNYQPVEAQGKIFHSFACNAGVTLGADLVSKGAVAFFGYTIPFAFDRKWCSLFADCDLQIDYALLAGKTCDDAYKAAYAAYTKGIEELLSKGEQSAAKALRGNRDNLVCPSTSAVYGDKTARLS